MKNLFIILVVLSLLGCEKESICMDCHEQYYIRLLGIDTKYYDTCYVECHDVPSKEFTFSQQTNDHKGMILHPLGFTYVNKHCVPQ